MSKFLNCVPVPKAKENPGSEILLVAKGVLSKLNPSTGLTREKVFSCFYFLNHHIKHDSYVYGLGNKTNLES